MFSREKDIKVQKIYLVLLLNAFSFSHLFTQNSAAGCNNWSTFFGADAQEDIKGICTGENGNVYVTGKTNSSNFYVTAGLIGDSIKGDYDAFAAKFDSCGTLLWSTLIGSTMYDAAEKIAFSQNGIVVCGTTSGTDFPVMNAYQPLNNGGYDAFVCRINANGLLQWSTHFGGTGADLAYDVTTDAAGNIYFGGSTNSSDLPTTSQSLQQTPAGAMDAYLASFNSAGNFRWCTYFGGSGSEDVHVLNTDKNASVYLAGGTFSQNIQMSANAYQQFNNGGMDIYVLKVDSSGNQLWSTYLGDAGLDDCYALACDSSGSVYLSGLTYSQLYPVTQGSFQDSLSGYSDMYLSKFSAAGNLIWSTFIGGIDLDDAKSLSINPAQEITLLGRTMSNDMPLSVTPLQDSVAGDYDLYIARFDSSGSFLYGSFIGGMMEDEPAAIAPVGLNFCYIGGSTYSDDYPVVTASHQTAKDSLQTAIATKIYIPSNVVSFANPSVTKTTACIYPNPAVDLLHIRCNENIQNLIVRDARGRLVIDFGSVNAANSIINIQSLQPGIYYITVKTKQSVHTKKFVKAHQ